MRDYWPILNYEIQMYFGARHLQGFPIKRTDPIITILQTSAMTEVKALHVRILAEIFLERTKRQQKDNFNIDDILPEWRKNNSTVAHNLGVAYDNKLKIGKSPRWYLNKYLAHPDKQRGDHFDWAPVIERMDKPLKDVFKTLPFERLEALRYFQKYLNA